MPPPLLWRGGHGIPRTYRAATLKNATAVARQRMSWASNPAQAAHSHSAVVRNSSASRGVAPQSRHDEDEDGTIANAEVFAPVVLAVLAEGVGDLSLRSMSLAVSSPDEDAQVGSVVGAEAVSSSSYRGAARPTHAGRVGGEVVCGGEGVGGDRHPRSTGDRAC
jgi:hypothetical protein